ncbi:hypothetical protein PSMK_08420 [Phycisphaera mikurensis NBRC 102666]|uniref:Uncharacterized protein n=1 Tax=Phycisphaera mikurensis (strain NBRC 102666 / KCTC 22515 / FYK2301M01) TaxID=1142394 RepID=I0ICL3_PHYMF|nr:hypothetical protein PSMK_08420 [Phycisphaera mikurensis NBRC 102666]
MRLADGAFRYRCHASRPRIPGSASGRADVRTHAGSRPKAAASSTPQKVRSAPHPLLSATAARGWVLPPGAVPASRLERVARACLRERRPPGGCPARAAGRPPASSGRRRAPGRSVRVDPAALASSP